MSVAGFAVPTLLMGNSQVFPSVRSSNSGFNNTAAATHTLNLPASYNAGDLLIILVAMQNNGTATWNTPPDWTAIGTLNNAQNGATQGALGAFYKVATGSEGSTVDVTVSASTWRQAYVTYALYNYSGVPEATKSADAGAGTSVDPPSLSPTGAASSTKYLFLTLGAWTHSNNASDDPDGYSNAVQGQGSTATGATIRTLRKQVTGTSDNPNTFTITSSRWLAGTIAIKGAGGAGSAARFLDSYSNVTGAWSVSRALVGSFGDSAKYETDVGVTRISNQASGSFDLIEATNTEEPTLQSGNLGPQNRNGVRFDGVDDNLSAAVGGGLFSVSAGYLVCCCIVRSVSTNSGTPTDDACIVCVGEIGISLRNSSGTYSWYVWNDDGSVDSVSQSVNYIDQVAVFEVRHEGGTLYGRVTLTGQSPSSWQSVSSGNTAGVSFIAVGNGSSAGTFCNMDLFEIVTMSSVPNDTQKDALVTNMLAHYG